MKEEVGVTIATHGWIGSEMTRGKFMLEEGADMQWKEEREVSAIATYMLHLNLHMKYIVREMLTNKKSRYN